MKIVPKHTASKNNSLNHKRTMLCSISGEEVVNAVVSPRSGAIFERKHIVNYISTTGTDPIDNQPLTEDELISIKAEPTIVPPKPVTGTSIPSLLATFQNEWDALALEVFTLRKQLYTAREELSSALYHQDAAVRVAANAIRERDEAQDALKELAFNLSKQEEPIEVGIPVDSIDAARAELYQLHKSIKPTYSVAAEQKISLEISDDSANNLGQVSSVHYDNSKHQFIVGTSSGEVVDLLNDIKFHVGAEATSVNVVDSGYIASTQDAIKLFSDGQVTELSKQANTTHLLVHPSLKNLFISVSPKSWSISNTQQLLFTGNSENNILSGDIHVDGGIFALGNDNSELQTFNLTNGDLISSTPTAHANVTEVKFALNGYWLLVASHSEKASSVEVIDLRKNIIIHTINFDGPAQFSLDPSSSLLATYASRKLSLHRYIKKGKKWLDNVSEVEVSDVFDIEILQAYNDTDFVNDNRLDVCLMLKDSRLVKYQVRQS